MISMPTFMVIVSLSNYMQLLLQFREHTSVQKLALPQQITGLIGKVMLFSGPGYVTIIVSKVA